MTRLLTTKQVAEKLAISTDTAYRLRNIGGHPVLNLMAVTMPDSDRPLWRESDVDNYINNLPYQHETEKNNA